MAPEKLAQLLNALCRMRETFVILGDGKRNNCIADTRLAIEILRHLGVHAEPVPVLVNVFNPPLSAKMLRHLDLTGELPSPELLNRWVREHLADGSTPWRIVSVGEEKNKGVWPGHLVALVEGRALLDMSIDQASRPEFGMPIRHAIVISPTAGIHRGDGGGEVGIYGGCLLAYSPTDDHSYRNTEAWNQPMDVVARELARSIVGRRRRANAVVAGAIESTMRGAADAWRA